MCCRNDLYYDEGNANGVHHSVDLIQNFILCMVCKICRVPSNLEANELSKVVDRDAVATCRDGSDFFSHLGVIAGELRRWGGAPIEDAEKQFSTW